MSIAGQFKRFVEELEVEETPIARWSAPEFCAKTKKQEVEPYITIYHDLLEVVDLVMPDDDGREYWGDFRPSTGMMRLQEIVKNIGRQAYQEVDNPLYDEVKCLSAKEENMKSWVKKEWGRE